MSTSSITSTQAPSNPPTYGWEWHLQKFWRLAWTNQCVPLTNRLLSRLSAVMRGYQARPGPMHMSLIAIANSLLCVALGREAVYSSSIRYLPQSDHTTIGFMHPFYRILADIQRLHRPQSPDVMGLWNACCALHQRLLTFWSVDDPFHASEDGDDLNMGSVCKSLRLLTWHPDGFLTCSTVLCYSILILYRPFLILRALENNRDVQGDGDLDDSSAGRERVKVMSKACQYSIDAATKIISFFRGLYETGLIQKVR